MEVVYSITNILNNKIYIGSTVNYEKRKKSHLRGLRGNYHENYKLQEDFNKYGEKCFVFDIIYKLEDGNDSERFRLEEEAIQLHLSYKHGYNLSYDGRGRYLITDKTREKMSKNTIGKNNPFYGKNHSEEFIIKMSKIASKRTGESNPFYGQSHNQETKNKISESIKKYYSMGNESVHKGVPKSEEHIFKNMTNQPNRKEVYAEGKVYISISACSKDLNITRSTVRNRINNKNFPDYYFLSDN